MGDASPKDLFLQSLTRCAQDQKFLHAFYERFMASSDEVRRKFKRTNFAKQHQMLLQSLRLAAGATAGEPQALSEIHERAETHNHENLDIAPHLYDFWRDALIETATEFDAEWNEEVAEAWTRLLSFIIKQMTKHY